MSRPLVLAALLLACGCAGVVRSTTGRLAENLSLALLDQDDPATVRDGAPAYLLMIDSFVQGSPDDVGLLLAGARLYGAYASAFVDDPARARRLATRAREYGRRALCAAEPAACTAAEGPYDGFVAALGGVRPGSVSALYGFAAAWAGWVRAHGEDWNAVADLPKIDAALTRVLALDDGHDGGGAHLALGVLRCLRPAALGGRPEEGRAYFERALALSAGKNLMAKVLFARHYARLVFDQELHDRLVAEVLAADPRAPGLTLVNTLAQAEALALRDTAADYF